MQTRLCFIPGMTRSGTTWITGWLGEHPEVASVQETYLIQHVVDMLLHEPQSGRIVSHDQVRTFLQDVYRQAACGKMCLVDKSPANFYYKNARINDLIWEIFPEARILWLIRDGKSFVHAVLNLPWGGCSKVCAALHTANRSP